ncbi:MAG: hypothetical protein WB791_01305 [Waddliaceae bacterium]
MQPVGKKFSLQQPCHVLPEASQLSYQGNQAQDSHQSFSERIYNIFSGWYGTSTDENSDAQAVNYYSRIKNAIVFVPSKVSQTTLKIGFTTKAIFLGLFTGQFIPALAQDDRYDFVRGAPSEAAKLCNDLVFNCLEGHIREGAEVVSQFARSIILEGFNANRAFAEHMSRCFDYQSLEETTKAAVNFGAIFPTPCEHNSLNRNYSVIVNTLINAIDLRGCEGAQQSFIVKNGLCARSYGSDPGDFPLSTAGAFVGITFGALFALRYMYKEYCSGSDQENSRDARPVRQPCEDDKLLPSPVSEDSNNPVP